MDGGNFRDRVAILDKNGERIPLFPAEVTGYWRRRRTIVQAVLILIFLVLPWLRVKGMQAVLFDVSGRHLVVFGFEFWSHDAPMIFLILAFIAFSLALSTALLGRIWCGWACPQTVFLDGVIRRIERWTEGTHLQRRELARAPLSVEKVARKTAKWTLFIGFSAVLTHSFLAYFVGTERLAHMVTRPPSENWTDFVFILAATGLVLFDLTWFREQFCMIVCPYGRFQSVLMDRNTVTVQYDARRGEPRRGTPDAKLNGDCVSCKRCVQVCPVGIDIRNGVQMECVGCTACIDACDEIMTKVKKPRGLIRYMASVEGKVRWLRPRVQAYSLILVVIVTAFAIGLARRGDLDVSLLRATDLPFFEKEGALGPVIVNGYRIHAHNETTADLRISVELVPGTTGARLEIPDGLLELRRGEFRMIPFIVEIPKRDFPAGGTLPLKIKIQEKIYEVQFVGPVTP